MPPVLPVFPPVHPPAPLHPTSVLWYTSHWSSTLCLPGPAETEVPWAASSSSRTSALCTSAGAHQTPKLDMCTSPYSHCPCQAACATGDWSMVHLGAVWRLCGSAHTPTPHTPYTGLIPAHTHIRIHCTPIHTPHTHTPLHTYPLLHTYHTPPTPTHTPLTPRTPTHLHVYLTPPHISHTLTHTPPTYLHTHTSLPPYAPMQTPHTYPYTHTP